jgi:hypothetical protein
MSSSVENEIRLDCRRGALASFGAAGVVLSVATLWLAALSSKGALAMRCRGGGFEEGEEPANDAPGGSEDCFFKMDFGIEPAGADIRRAPVWPLLVPLLLSSSD